MSDARVKSYALFSDARVHGHAVSMPMPVSMMPLSMAMMPMSMSVVPIMLVSLLIDDLRLDHNRRCPVNWSRLDVSGLDVSRLRVPGCHRLNEPRLDVSGLDLLDVSGLPVHWGCNVSGLLHDDLWLLVDNGRLDVRVAVAVMVVSVVVMRHLDLFRLFGNYKLFR